MPFPDVPIAPGVPALPRDPNIPQSVIPLLTSDTPGLIPGSPIQQQWGLFLNGVAAITAESVQSFDFRSDWTIADYPVEGGQFESYDKVTNPFDIKLRFQVGGPIQAREALLASLEIAAPSLNLYDAQTPERTYTNVNITHYSYQRTATRGLGLLVVDVWVQQVRVSATVQFTGAQPVLTSTKSPSGASPVADGTVTAIPASQVQSRFVFQ